MASSELESKTVNDSVLSILRCSNCLDYIVPPVIQCVDTGHLMCVTCQPKFKSCPNCRSVFIGNPTLEKITEVVMYPCKYASDGCNTKICGSDKKDHEDFCEYQTIQCQFRTCKKKIPKCDYSNHLDSVHCHQSTPGVTKVVDLPLTSAATYEWPLFGRDKMYTVKMSVADPYIYLWSVFPALTHMEDDKNYLTFHIKHHKSPHNSVLFSCTLDVLGSKNFAFPLELAKKYAGDSHTLSIEIKVHEEK